MTANPISYVFSCLFVILAHCAMLVNVFINGSYTESGTVILLAASVLILDIAYFIAMPFFKQSSYTIDFLLILILNMSMIFQSSFGGIHFAMKHYITVITALIACRFGYILCRSHNRIQSRRKQIYIMIAILFAVIFAFTGSRSMWVSFGSVSIQPSEFIKPLFVLACATSVTEQQKKHKILCFNVVYENIALFGLMIMIFLVQWWCRDLGSLPTFIGIYICGFLLRICYPRAKFSKKTFIAAGIVLLATAVAAFMLAPAYVQERLHVDIWKDTDGSGYQQSRALIGIANGGWFGAGPGHGRLCEVFAHDNDIVFATVCEEWGLLYALMMICVILILLAIPIINPPRSYFHGTVAAGVCAAFTVQMALNIFGSCNMIPFTGVTIPFISTGGSSMAVSGFMIGMLIAGQSPELGKRRESARKLPSERRYAR